MPLCVCFLLMGSLLRCGSIGGVDCDSGGCADDCGAGEVGVAVGGGGASPTGIVGIGVVVDAGIVTRVVAGVGVLPALGGFNVPVVDVAVVAGVGAVFAVFVVVRC
ncbi:Hypothetical predicted protein [Octopus vulgaris]|uniref:Secreted protein n=1 Tax=Octopus vulgaris TaxID=6645 RepID=A0AA36B9X0_OCTVU|nr:Hypothetical predicted protein [Octopus vulgaris]